MDDLMVRSAKNQQWHRWTLQAAYPKLAGPDFRERMSLYRRSGCSHRSLELLLPTGCSVLVLPVNSSNPPAFPSSAFDPSSKNSSSLDIYVTTLLQCNPNDARARPFGAVTRDIT